MQFIGFFTNEPLSKKVIPLSGVIGVFSGLVDAAVGRPLSP